MVVCKFFLQGYCRFGDNCKFEHQVSDTYNSNKTQHTSILWQSQLHNSQYGNSGNTSYQKQSTIFNLQENKPASTTNVDVETLIKSVINDMTAFEHSKQWLLSCYGPFKEKPVFPGFLDYAFEEIRFGFYDAIKNGTVEQYKQHVNNLLQQAMLRIKSLQKPTPEITEILTMIYNNTSSQNNSAIKSLFGNASTLSQNTFTNPSISIFAQTNQNLFGKPAAPTPTFSSTTSSIFGQNVNQPQINQSTFGEMNTSIPAPNSGSVFGNITPSLNTFQASPVFCQQQSNQSSLFNKPTLFPQPNISSPSSLFGSQGTPNLPPSQSPLVSTPHVSSENNALINFQQQSSLFNSSTFPQTTPNPQQTPIFSGNQSTNTFNNSPLFQTRNEMSQNDIFLRNVHDESLYSMVEELTQDEIQWFQSNDLGNLIIPEKPPTFEMCFKI